MTTDQKPVTDEEIIRWKLECAEFIDGLIAAVRDARAKEDLIEIARTVIDERDQLQAKLAEIRAVANDAIRAPIQESASWVSRFFEVTRE